MDLKIFATNPEQSAVSQITALAEHPAFSESKIRIMPDVHAGAGCVVGFTADLGERVIPNVVGVDIGCLDKDTEILTPTGWIKISQYGGEQILTYDKNSDQACFDTPLAYITKPCEHFYKFHHRKGLDQLVSDEHKILYFHGTRSRGWSPVDYMASEFATLHAAHKKPLWGGFKAAFSLRGGGVDFTDDEIRLFVAISADGCVKHENANGKWIEFHVKKQRKVDRVLLILEKLSIGYRITEHKDKTTCIRFYVRKEFDKSIEIFYGANAHQLAIVGDECLYWDGCVDEKRNHKYFSTTNKASADVIQFAWAANGIRSFLYTRRGNNRWNHAYYVGQTKNPYVGMQTEPIETVASKDGKKYCFTTKTGYFVARRSNNIFVTGNCGVQAEKLDLRPQDINQKVLKQLDRVIRQNVPSGFSVNSRASVEFQELDSLLCYSSLRNPERIMLALGSLGGGNHFIEVDMGDDGSVYLVVHTGSRNLGKQVADHYQEMAESAHTPWSAYERERERIIRTLKSQGESNRIQQTLKSLSSEFFGGGHYVSTHLSFLKGDFREAYLHDMRICQVYANVNRETIAAAILKKMGWGGTQSFTTVHNYIDHETNIVRKGAVSARKGERLIIPINMRDGSLICVGKGNPDWNCSAPHGAGRILSRSQARKNLSLQDYQKTMSGIYSTSVSASTIDEAPDAYKPMSEIVSAIGDTVDILSVVRPLYNFKASE